MMGKNLLLRFVEANEETGGGASEDEAPKNEDPKNEAPKNEETPEQTIARLQKELRETRGESVKQRLSAKDKAAQEAQQKLIGDVLAALGLDKDGNKATSAEELMAELERAKEETKQLRLREAVRSVATGDATVDPARLLRDAEFLASIKELDPSDTSGVKAAIEATLEAAPWLKVVQETQAPRRSGPDGAGSPGEGKLTKDEFAKMSGAERNKLFRERPDVYRSLNS